MQIRKGGLTSFLATTESFLPEETGLLVERFKTVKQLRFYILLSRVTDIGQAESWSDS